MRPDMAKVITERPRSHRYGAIKGRRRAKEITHLEQLPFRQSTARRRRPYGTEKQLTDLLGPLEGFLRSNCGRPWDKVYSEIRRNISVRRQVDMHILDHVGWMVEKDIEIVDGLPYRKTRGPWSNDVIGSEFFVHPRTGLLLENREARNRRYKRNRSKRRPKFLVADALTQIRLLNGLLFEVKLEYLPEEAAKKHQAKIPVWQPFHDVLFGDLHISDCLRIYGAYVYAVRKFQLCKKALKVWRPKSEAAGLAETFDKEQA